MDASVGDLGRDLGRGIQERNDGAYQTHQVKTAIALLRPLTRRQDGLVLVKRLFLDRDVDTNDVLPDDASSPNVQVSSPALERAR